MAKRKHSTALFEVITTSRRYTKPHSKPQAAGGSPAWPFWWLKRGAKPERVVEDDVPAVGVARIHTPTEETPVIPEHRWAEEPPAEHEEYGHSDDSIHPEQNTGDDVLGMPRAQSVAVSVDPDRRQIALRMSYTAAIIGAFSVLVLVGLAIIVGQHMSRSGAPLLAQTTSKALQENPAHREVMDVSRQTVNNPNLGGPGANSGRPPGSPPAGSPQPVPSTALESKRLIGLNYVIVQGYAAKEEEMAAKAAAFLTKHGIPCTVEKDVKGYSAVTVVGLKGFERQTSTDIKAYIQKIEDLSAEYTTNSRGYKAFTPLIKKWDKMN